MNWLRANFECDLETLLVNNVFHLASSSFKGGEAITLVRPEVLYICHGILGSVAKTNRVGTSPLGPEVLLSAWTAMDRRT